MKSCQVLSSNALLRATISVPDEKNMAYSKFRTADQDLWDDATRPGDEGILWVQGEVTLRSRTKKRSRRDRDESADEDDGLMAAALLRRRRQRAG
jgi:hypothetical protein